MSIRQFATAVAAVALVAAATPAFAQSQSADQSQVTPILDGFGNPVIDGAGKPAVYDPNREE